MLKRLCLLAAVALCHPVSAEEVQFRYGLDILDRPQSSVDAFQSITALREIRPGLYFGQSLYSAAAGDAGGLFLGGFDLIKSISLGQNTALEFGGFVGGGGGAFVVDGDGLMTRAHIGLRQRLTDTLAATFGVSYIDISGSDISTPALSFGITRDVDFAMSRGHAAGTPTEGRVVRAVKPLVKQFRPRGGNRTRSGNDLGTITLLGFEASFAASPEALTEDLFAGQRRRGGRWRRLCRCAGRLSLENRALRPARFRRGRGRVRGAAAMSIPAAV